MRDLSLTISPHDNRDHIAESIYPESLAIPSSLDLRQKIPSIRDQGNQGTCAAHSAACMKEYQEHIDIGFKEHFSPQFVYNLRQNQESSGMHLRDVMKILHKKGICKEEDYPYGSKEIPHPFVSEDAQNHKIKAYAAIKSIQGLKKALLRNGPCIIAFPVYNKGTRMWMPETKTQKFKGGHAMAVVGYDSNGFIIRNSWGPYWGKNGYCTYAYDDWGSHWEIWTTIDDKSEVLPERSFSCCF